MLFLFLRDLLHLPRKPTSGQLFHHLLHLFKLLQEVIDRIHVISAARRDCIGATLYLAGYDAKTGELLSDTTPCSMCRRQIINAGIEKVVIRDTPTEYRVVDVQREWVEEDDSLPCGC